MIAQARLQAWQRVTRSLPAAAAIHAVRGWLDRAPAAPLARELMRCVVAADCWNARRACPRSGLGAVAWQRYFEARHAALLPLLARSLARWAVLERIPEHWIPVAHVQAVIRARYGRPGAQPRLTAATLVPPVLGGADWVRRDGAVGDDGIAALLRLQQKSEAAGSGAAAGAEACVSVVAALLQWPGRMVAAVVVAAAGHLTAFGDTFDAEGTVLDAAELASAVVIPGAAVPPWWLARCLQALGLRDLAWRGIRAWRVRRGGPRLAAL